MHAIVMRLLIAWAAASVANHYAPEQEDAPPVPPRSSPPTIAVRRTDPVQVVFLGHTGPYWRVGPLLVRVREYMFKHSQSGPMFMRHLQNPVSATTQPLRSEIGFIVEGDHQPEPPFRTARRDGELVACMVVKGRTATTRGDYGLIQEWIRAHGYDAAGPVVEIFDPVQPKRPSGTQRTEIQVVLKGTERVTQSVAPESAPPPDLRRPQHAEPAPALEQYLRSGAAREGEAAAGAQAEQAADELDAPLTHDVAAEPAAEVTGTPSVGKQTPTPKPQSEPLLPVLELVEANRFNRIAEQLMPDDLAIPTPHQVWLGQVVFRIGAAAKGVKQVHPGAEQTAVALAGAITRRYKRVSVNFMADPLAQAVVRADAHTDPLAGRKRAIMRNLDTLLGRIALRSVDADSTVEELARVIQRVQDLLRSEGRKRKSPQE